MSQQDAAYEVYDFTLENKLTVDVLVNNAGFGDFGNFSMNILSGLIPRSAARKFAKKING